LLLARYQSLSLLKCLASRARQASGAYTTAEQPFIVIFPRTQAWPSNRTTTTSSSSSSNNSGNSGIATAAAAAAAAAAARACGFDLPAAAEERRKYLGDRKAQCRPI